MSQIVFLIHKDLYINKKKLLRWTIKLGFNCVLFRSDSVCL